jgi:hypothetical protein
MTGLILAAGAIACAAWLISRIREQNLAAEQEGLRRELEGNIDSYRSRVEKLKSDASGRSPIFFHVKDTGGAVGAQIFYYLVYDDTGEILLPADKRSRAWNEAEARGPDVVRNPRCGSRIAPISASFYSVISAC